MYLQLTQEGVEETHILMPKDHVLPWTRGWQYFDVFTPQNEEIFVDAGSFKGETIIDFIKWSNENYKKIYALEPLKDMYHRIQEMGVLNAEVYNYAAWNKKDQLRFAEQGPDSRITNHGIEVKAVDIDSIVKDKVTFLKMDIEGSELKALEGAKNTIIKDHPRLAICIYHKPEDVIEIPAYILSLVSDYRFYIRHYHLSMSETVLYAQV